MNFTCMHHLLDRQLTLVKTSNSKNIYMNIVEESLYLSKENKLILLKRSFSCLSNISDGPDILGITAKNNPHIEATISYNLLDPC